MVTHSMLIISQEVSTVQPHVTGEEPERLSGAPKSLSKDQSQDLNSGSLAPEAVILSVPLTCLPGAETSDSWMLVLLGISPRGALLGMLSLFLLILRASAQVTSPSGGLP